MYINMDNSCLTKAEKKEIRELVYKYKDTFSLRDEIGMYPNIDIEVNVMDKFPFLIRPFHAREENKTILDKEMKRLCYLGILKEGFSAYSSKYLVQTRAQTKSSCTKLPEVHGAKKDLIPHVKSKNLVPSVHPIPPTCHLRPIHHIPYKDQRPPTNTLPPVPKPRIGQGRAGIRRKPKVVLPIPKVIQIPTLTMPTPAPRTVLSLTEPISQSQDNTIPQPQVPNAIKPLIQPTPASITKPLEPRIDPRPIPLSHEPFLRPPPMPPRCDSRKR